MGYLPYQLVSRNSSINSNSSFITSFHKLPLASSVTSGIAAKLPCRAVGSHSNAVANASARTGNAPRRIGTVQRRTIGPPKDVTPERMVDAVLVELLKGLRFRFCSYHEPYVLMWIKECFEQFQRDVGNKIPCRTFLVCWLICSKSFTPQNRIDFPQQRSSLCWSAKSKSKQEFEHNPKSLKSTTKQLWLGLPLNPLVSFFCVMPPMRSIQEWNLNDSLLPFSCQAEKATNLSLFPKASSRLKVSHEKKKLGYLPWNPGCLIGFQT